MSDPAKPRRGFWGWCRCSFRWFRIACLAVVLLVLLTLTWLRFVGLPDFIRGRLVAELRGHGIDADFSALRFHWFRGFVASDLRVAWGGTNGPRIAIAEADLDIAPPPWHERRDIIRGLAVRRGSVVLPLPLTNEPPQELLVDRVAADVRFLPGDAWEVRRLSAEALGLNLELRASLTNLAALRTSRGPSDPRAIAQRLRLARSVVDELAHWSAPEMPHLEVNLHLDGRRPQAADGNAYLEAGEVRTPHGDIRRLRISLRVPPTPPATNLNAAADAADAETAGARSYFNFELGELQTAHGGLSGLSARLHLTGPPRPALPTLAGWNCTIDHVFVRGFRAHDLSVQATNELLAQPAGMTREDLAAVPVLSRLLATARRFEVGPGQDSPYVTTNFTAAIAVRHTLSTNLPATLQLDLAAGRTTGNPGATGPLAVHAELARSATPPPLPGRPGPWRWAWPFTGVVQVGLTNLAGPRGLNLGDARIALDWQPPTLAIRELEAGLYGGRLSARGTLDVATREANVEARTTCDLHGIDGLLGPKSRENFARYQWRRPPTVEATARAVLPPWDEKAPDWNGTVKPTLDLRARFSAGEGSFKGVTFSSAESSLTYNGNAVRLPDLHTTRPEGAQDVVVEYFDDTRAYRVDARGTILPNAIRPLIGDKSAEVLDLFTFQEPAAAVVSIWGPWSEGSQQSIVGTVQATNLTFRGHHFDRVAGSVVYTNRFLSGTTVRIGVGDRELVAGGVGYDFDSDLLSLTNTVSTIDPALVAAAISPEFPEKLKHYRFDTPPRVRVEGTVRPRTAGTADLLFDIEGGPFHFWRFASPQITTRLWWHGQGLILTNINASFYQGRLTGDAAFDLSDPTDGLYRFNALVRDARLEDLLRDMTLGKTNVAQGNFDLDLNIHSGRTSSLWTWNGDGTANLRDGLLWDVPIFSFMSPVLNAIAPGLGNNRAKRADATFVVTNGVFQTRDLSIACPPAKLLYRGTIDFDQKVNAKVEAQVLTEIGGFGPLFGLVLKPLTKLLEFRVTGTLSSVNAEPLYIPKLLYLPLQPFRALLGIFGGSGAPKDHPAPVTSTNAAPESPVVPAPDPVPPFRRPEP